MFDMIFQKDEKCPCKSNNYGNFKSNDFTHMWLHKLITSFFLKVLAGAHVGKYKKLVNI